MIKEFILVVFAGTLMLCSVADATNHTEYLEEAVENLVDYAAAKSGNVLDSLDIKKRVISIAQEQFDAKIGKYTKFKYHTDCVCIISYKAS